IQQALAWLHKAAEQGNASAQFNLGLIYAKGQGVPQDYKQAHAWFSVAAANGYSNATKGRDMAAAELTP
ncbi:tetratricopeptide repeat protein, partial [Aeromonas caviae]|uniref:tetratricopeptide repeat protein n=1 Tax=Aeromonas caviae TaxID=648 RepID=UPI0035A229CC